MKRWLTLFVFSLFTLALLSACSAKELTVRDAWSRPAAQGGNGAVFFVIDNPTAQDDILMGVQTDIAMMASLHRSIMNGDVMKMEPQESVSVPAKGQVAFKPGDYHVMLMNLKQDLNVGDTFTITLQFKNAGEITLEVPVQEQ